MYVKCKEFVIESFIYKCIQIEHPSHSIWKAIHVKFKQWIQKMKKYQRWLKGRTCLEMAILCLYNVNVCCKMDLQQIMWTIKSVLMLFSQLNKTSIHHYPRAFNAQLQRAVHLQQCEDGCKMCDSVCLHLLEVNWLAGVHMLWLLS